MSSYFKCLYCGEERFHCTGNIKCRMHCLCNPYPKNQEDNCEFVDEVVECVEKDTDKKFLLNKLQGINKECQLKSIK